MIRTRADLKFYLTEDAKRNNVPKSKLGYYLRLVARTDHACIFRYIKCMRKCEYHFNNSQKLWHKVWYYYYRFVLSRLGMKYNMSIRLNACEYGLRIMHLSGGGGVRIGAIRVGKYCGFNSGVLIGTNGGEEARPIIGDHVAFGPGAKAFGSITIGNNVFVAANSVVTKDIPDNCIVGGVPAKVIKEKPLKEESETR